MELKFTLLAEKYNYLVLNFPSKDEMEPSFSETLANLSNVGFVVHTVIINPENKEVYYENKADEILRYLKG